MLKRLLFFLCLFHYSIQAFTVALDHKDPTTTVATISFSLGQDKLYKEFMSFDVDSPDIDLSAHKTEQKAITFYDNVFKKEKKAYQGNVQFVLTAKKRTNQPADQANIHFSYYLQSKKRIKQAVIPLSFTMLNNKSSHNIAIQSEQTINNTTSEQEPITKKTSLSDKISLLLTTSNSFWFRMLLALLLGLLLSLTPCIYPMIPITVGILQSQATKSVFSNICLSLCYTIGIATTYALLGLLVATTGQLFGSIMASPIVILLLVAMLVYLSLSMIGLYELKIPSALQTTTSAGKGGNYISALVFGMASGLVASPCLSPGLILLLTIVAAMASKFLGFILLFAFGVGLSIPLLIIGSFSGALSVLPRAGQWMIELKKVFGFIMLASCFYFLKAIVPAMILYWGLSLFVLITGLYYLKTISLHDTNTWRWLKNSTGIACCALSVVLAFQAFKNTVGTIDQDSLWLHDYQQALQLAQKEGKKVFIDIGAPYCSICTAIDTTLFADHEVQSNLQKDFVCLKVDGSKDACLKEIEKECKIIGFPTILVMDPANHKVVKKWQSELYGTSSAEFIHDLQAIK